MFKNRHIRCPVMESPYHPFSVDLGNKDGVSGSLQNDGSKTSRIEEIDLTDSQDG